MRRGVSSLPKRFIGKFAISLVALTLFGIPAAVAAKPVHPVHPGTLASTSSITTTAADFPSGASWYKPSPGVGHNPQHGDGHKPDSGVGGRHNPVKPKVMFVLRGTFSTAAITASATTITPTATTISITVRSSNFERFTLKGQLLTFLLDSTSKIVLHHGSPIADGDRGIVKVEAQKNASVATLEAGKVFQVIDQGAYRRR